jgi:hypothetical protein
MSFVPRIIPGGKAPPEPEEDHPPSRENAREGLRLLSAFSRIRSREQRLKVIELAEEIAARAGSQAETIY